MSLLELIDAFTDWWCSWRFYLSILITVSLSIAFHNQFGGSTLSWCISLAIVLTGVLLGWRWQRKSDMQG